MFTDQVRSSTTKHGAADHLHSRVVDEESSMAGPDLPDVCNNFFGLISVQHQVVDFTATLSKPSCSHLWSDPPLLCQSEQQRAQRTQPWGEPILRVMMLRDYDLSVTKSNTQLHRACEAEAQNSQFAYYILRVDCVKC